MYLQIIENANTQIGCITENTECSLKRSELLVVYLIDVLDDLRGHIIRHTFKNQQEEILFFKQHKPSVFSKLIYNSKVLQIETKRPNGSDKTQHKYLLNELDNLNRFFDNNLEFYQYYRTGAKYLDDKYFVRNRFDIHLPIDTFFFTSDKDFSTTHDFKVSKILANDLLEIYLKEQLALLERKDSIHLKSNNHSKSKISWTDTKAGLTELLYAFYYQKSFNNGNADIKLIAEQFEQAFQVDLGDVYRTWHAIRNRKTESSSYIEGLSTLLKKVIEQENTK